MAYKQMQNNTQVYSPQSGLPGANVYRTNPPGKLRWFETGTCEYQNWVDQRAQFIKVINAQTQEENEILNDILDALLQTDISIGIISTISIMLKVTKKARSTKRRRLLFYNVVNAIIQMTFTAPTHSGDEFVFTFNQIQHIWRGSGGGELLPVDNYKLLYSTIDTKLRVGMLKNIIVTFPELDRYTEYKLRQFKDSFHRYQLSLVED